MDSGTESNFTQQSSLVPELTPCSIKKRKYKTRSPVWNHCKKMVIDKEIRIKCNYCTIHYSYGNGATSNIINHLRTKHLDKLENEELCDRPLNNDSSEDNSDSDSEETNKKKRKKNEHCLDYYLLKFIISASLPFQIVENDEFREFIRKLNSGYNLPGRHKLSNLTLNSEYQNVISIIQNNFASATAIAITLDLWTSIQRLPYLGVTCHYIDSDFNLKSATIAVKHLPGQHKSEKIKDELLGLMEKWNITDKVFGFVSDHASNVIDIVFNINNSLNSNNPTNKYNIVQFGCAAHLLNLIIKNITKFTKINGELDIGNFGNVNEDELVQSNDECGDLLTILTKSELETLNDYVNIVNKCRKIVTAYHHSQIFSNQLNLAQNSLNIKNHQLIKDVSTRWNSTYLMVERVYEQADAINEALKSRELCRKFDVLKLNEEEKESMEEIISVLACFYDATVILSGSKYTTLSLVIPAFETLRNALIILKNDKPLTKCLKKFMLYWTSFYLNKYQIFNNQYLITATFLDVRTKNFSRFSEDNKKKFSSLAKSTIKSIYSKFPDHVKVQITASSQKVINEKSLKNKSDKVKSGFQCFDFDNETATSKSMKNWDQAQKEIYKYSQEASKNIDPLEYWRINNETFPILYYIAKQLFCVPASSVPAENLFSHAGYNVWDRRNRISPQRVDKIMVIYENLKKN